MKYSMFIGRWQPWHDGHRWLIDQRLNENKNVLICIREVSKDDKNPYDPHAVKENIEKELAEEILFGLVEKTIIEGNQLSTMNLILLKANTGEVSDAIRDEIDENFVKEMSIEDKFDFKWKDEQEILDAVKESERIREKNFNNESISEGDIPIKKRKVKKKKKKRFFIF